MTMKVNFKGVLAFLVFLIGVGVGYETVRMFDKKKLTGGVLSEAIEVTIAPTSDLTGTPAATITVFPTSKPTLVPTLTPRPTQIPHPTVDPTQIHGFIDRFSAQYVVDPNILRHIAICESGFNPRAVNGPYAGLYQFGKSTWDEYRRSMGEDNNPDLRFNPEEAIQTASFALSKGKKRIWPNCYP